MDALGCASDATERGVLAAGLSWRVFCADPLSVEGRWRSRRSRWRGCRSGCGWSCCSSRSGSACSKRDALARCGAFGAGRASRRGRVAARARWASRGDVSRMGRGDSAGAHCASWRCSTRTRRRSSPSDVWDLRKAGLVSEGATSAGLLGDHAGLAPGGRQAVGLVSNDVYAGTPSVQGWCTRCRCYRESLGLREDGGREKSALARGDMRAFVERLGRLHRAGRLSDTTYYRSCAQGASVPDASAATSACLSRASRCTG